MIASITFCCAVIGYVVIVFVSVLFSPPSPCYTNNSACLSNAVCARKYHIGEYCFVRCLNVDLFIHDNVAYTLELAGITFSHECSKKGRC